MLVSKINTINCISRYRSFLLAGFSTVKENFVGTDPGLSRILCPPSGFIKQSLSKCLLQTYKEFLVRGVFSRRSLTSHADSSFLLLRGSKCHERSLHSSFELLLVHP